MIMGASQRGGVDLRVRLGRLELANPVIAAAGTFGYGVEFARAVRLDRLGALVIKTITMKPREGNPPPRVVETPAGMLNSVGLQNVGLEAFLREKLPTLSSIPVPIIVSMLGDTPEEVGEMCRRLDQEKVVVAIELNLSCPNVHRSTPMVPPPAASARGGSAPEAQATWAAAGGGMVAQDVDATIAMVQVARAKTTKPLIAKLSPDVTDPRPIAQAAQRAGADALTVSNTFTGMSLDPRTRRSRLGSLTGGVSGPAIRPLALYRVWLAHQAAACPIIGLGGMLTAGDAVEFLLAGATAVAVGTANFRDPSSGPKIVAGLRRYLERHGLASVQQLVGALEHDAVAV